MATLAAEASCARPKVTAGGEGELSLKNEHDEVTRCPGVRGRGLRGTAGNGEFKQGGNVREEIQEW